MNTDFEEAQAIAIKHGFDFETLYSADEQGRHSIAYKFAHAPNPDEADKVAKALIGLFRNAGIQCSGEVNIKTDKTFPVLQGEPSKIPSHPDAIKTTILITYENPKEYPGLHLNRRVLTAMQGKIQPALVA